MKNDGFCVTTKLETPAHTHSSIVYDVIVDGCSERGRGNFQQWVMLFNKVISRGENFPIPRGMPLRFDANGKKSPRNRLEEMLFVLLHPITQKALSAPHSARRLRRRTYMNGLMPRTWTNTHSFKCFRISDEKSLRCHRAAEIKQKTDCAVCYLIIFRQAKHGAHT